MDQVCFCCCLSAVMRGLYNKEMSTDEIDEILSNNPITDIFYMRCFPSNKLPKCEHFPCSMVVNFDEHTKPGTHWVAVYAPDSTEAHYFDSFGGGETDIENINEYLQDNFELVTNRSKAIQSRRSKVCGYYAIFFIYLSSKGIPFKRIERLLLKEKRPDALVYKYVNEKIKMSI